MKVLALLFWVVKILPFISFIGLLIILFIKYRRQDFDLKQYAISIVFGIIAISLYTSNYYLLATPLDLPDIFYKITSIIIVGLKSICWGLISLAVSCSILDSEVYDKRKWCILSVTLILPMLNAIEKVFNGWAFNICRLRYLCILRKTNIVLNDDIKRIGGQNDLSITKTRGR